MTHSFDSMEAAFEVLSDPSNAQWAQAFAYLFTHPETSEMMLETFRDTLKDMGAEPGSIDPSTGEPVYSLADVAKAMGIPETDLDQAVDAAQAEGDG